MGINGELFWRENRLSNLAMKLRRWLMLSLIAVSSVALLAVPAWLWVEKPRRTARAFIVALQASDEGRVNALLTSGVCYVMETDDHLLRIDPQYGPSELFVPSRCQISMARRTASDRTGMVPVIGP